MTTSHIYLFNNKTTHDIKSDVPRYAWAGFLLFVTASSLIGDSIILIASFKYRAFKLHKVLVVIIQHIALCDLMVTTTNVLPKLVSLISRGWVFGNLLCNLAAYTSYFFEGTGLFLICNMTTTKVLLLKYPFRYRAISVKKIHMVCGACWLATLILIAIALIILALDGNDIYFSYRTYYCDFGFTAEIWKWMKPLLAGIAVFIPNCLVVASTVYLLAKAKEVAHRGRKSLKWQGIITTVLTAIFYGISVLPFVVYAVGEQIVPDDGESTSFYRTSFYRIAESSLYLNTISNFYIYSLSVQSFRDFIRSRIQQTFRIFTSIGTSAGKSTGTAVK